MTTSIVQTACGVWSRKNWAKPEIVKKVVFFEEGGVFEGGKDE